MFIYKRIAIIFGLLSNLSILCGIANLVEKSEKRPMTTSVIVPCIARHFFWISGMLEAYQNQTKRPDEVVISLCDAKQVDPHHINLLERGQWDFKLKILRHDQVIIDGDNRTIAMDNSSGDILIFSDADDIPHPQRVEITKYFFENYEVDHLVHCWTAKREDITHFSMDTINVLRFPSGQALINSGYYVTTGSPCFLRKIGDVLKWSAIEDQAHAILAYKMFKNTMFLPHPLILYRMHLSSHSYS